MPTLSDPSDVLPRLAAVLDVDVPMLEAILAGEVDRPFLSADVPAGLVVLGSYAGWRAAVAEPPRNDREWALRQLRASGGAPATGFVVYRLLDPAGRVVYVGSSRCPRRRLQAHQRAWPRAWCEATFETYPDAAAMLSAERDAIAELAPPLNVTGLAG